MCAHASANAKGSYGCEVWINTKVPFLYINDVGVFATRENVSIKYIDPRILIIVVSIRALKIFVVCAHAPHSLDETRAKWWTKFVNVVKIHTKGAVNIYFGIDANTTSARSVTPGVDVFGRSMKHSPDAEKWC